MITNRGHITIVSKEVMAKILSSPKVKYDAKKAEKTAKRKLRKQGLRL